MLHLLKQVKTNMHGRGHCISQTHGPCKVTCGREKQRIANSIPMYSQRDKSIRLTKSVDTLGVAYMVRNELKIVDVNNNDLESSRKHCIMFNNFSSLANQNVFKTF